MFYCEFCEIFNNVIFHNIYGGPLPQIILNQNVSRESSITVPHKKAKIQRFSDIFMGYRNGILTRNGLKQKEDVYFNVIKHTYFQPALILMKTKPYHGINLVIKPILSTKTVLEEQN